MPHERRNLVSRKVLLSRAARPSNSIIISYIPPWVAREISQLAAPSGYIYVRTTSFGAGDGSSWANATTLNSLNTLISQAASQNKWILVRADEGEHTPTTQQTITSKGKSRDLPVVIMGVNGDLTPANATITGDRAIPFSPGAANGTAFLRPSATAAFITFTNLRLKAWGNFILFTASGCSDIAALDCAAENMTRFIDGNSGITQSRITIRRIDARSPGGFEKGFSRFRGDSHDIYLQKVFADGGGAYDEPFPEGFGIEETAHYIIYDQCEGSNFRAIDTTDPTIYWNGDAFSGERGNYGIVHFSCKAWGCTDGGYDYKSTNCYWFNCDAWDNKNNYRLWGDAILYGCTSRDPFKRGGTGVTCHFNIAQSTTPNLHIINCTRSDTDPNTKTFYVEHAATLFYTPLKGSTLGALAQYEQVLPLGTITQIPSTGVAPVITSPSFATVMENDAFSMNLTALGSPLFWMLSGGADYQQFLLDGWFLTRSATPSLTMGAQDYENPVDSLQLNSYAAQVTAFSEALVSTRQNIRVAVSDVVFEGDWIYDGDYFEVNLGQADYTFATFNPRGNWVTATSYAVGDTVSQSGLTYYCLTAHTSNIFSTDLNNKKWDVAGSTLYTLNNALDSAKFTMTYNTLRLLPQDYSNPLDANADNIYEPSITATVLATGATSTVARPVQIKPVVLTAGVRYIGPSKAGNGDGLSIANRAAPAQMNAMIKAAGPDGFVDLVSDVGNFSGGFGTITNGGAPGHPVTIRGVDSSGNPATINVVGTRTPFTPPSDPSLPTSTSGWTAGATMVNLGLGANHLKFDGWAPMNLGAFVTCVGDCHDIVLRNINAFNFQRFWEQNHYIAVSDLDMDATVIVQAFSKQCHRMRGGSSNHHLVGAYFDSMRQNRDNFAAGSEMSEFAHHRYLTSCTMKNTYDDINAFWNGDGASSEVTNWLDFIDGGEYSGNTDAGLDLKGDQSSIGATMAVLLKDNRANLKMWYGIEVITDIDSRDPHQRGGSGHTDHIDCDGSQPVVWRTDYTGHQHVFVGAACKFTDTNAACAIYHGEPAGPGSTHVHVHVAPGVTESTAGSRTFSAGVVFTIDDFTSMPPYSVVGVGAAHVTATSGNLTISGTNIPSGLQQNDLLIFPISYRDNTAPFSLPAGVSQVGPGETSGNTLSNTSAKPSAIFAYMTVGAVPPTSVTFTRTGGSVAECRAIAYRKADGTAFSLGAIVSLTLAASTSTPSFTGLTTTHDNSLMIAFHADGRADTHSGFAAATDPTGVSGATNTIDFPHPAHWFERIDNSSATSPQTAIAIFDAIKATHGSTGNFSDTLAGGNNIPALIAAEFY